MPDFTHLHVHSEYSMLDGLSRIKDLVAQTKAQGMRACALTDHGVMHGAIHFYREAGKAGIKPIIGCEVYVAPRRMTDRQPKVDSNPYHLTLLARDHAGYRNLIKLVSKANLEGFYYKPRIDRDLLAQHAAGITALSGCLGAQVPQLLLTGREQEAVETIGWFRDVFGAGGYYLELQDHQIPEQQAINRFLVDYGRREGLPLVCTNDVHYVQREDAEAQDILLCVQTGTTVDEPKRMRMATPEFYLKSPQAMAALFAEVPDALSNTCRIADDCDLKLEFGRTALPEFALPDGHSAESYFSRLTRDRFPQRYPDADQALRDRLEFELGVICQLGFAQYFLIVADYTNWARQRGIMAEPRGSVGGSVVAYAAGISSVDPIRYDLPFERFLSPERREMPDIDMDFPDDRRAEVYEYVRQKYGPDHVAQIITFNTMLGKAAIRDVGRALGMPFNEVDRVAKLIPNGVKVTIDQGLTESAELRGLVESDATVKKLLDTARKVEGVARNASVHAAGVVISSEPLMDVVPLQKAGHADLVTQYDGSVLPEIGILKMDFLGLANFSILDRAVKFIKQTQGIDIDLRDLPHDDDATFALCQTGETTGLFQLESAGMRKYLKELKPTTIRDLSAMISLYRPGPMDNIPRFIAGKRGGKVDYAHPDLEPILAESYGVIVYQEQVMAIAVQIAGFTPEQGYKFIKAIAKKNAELLQKNKEPFVEGALARGYSQQLAEELWRLFEPFQRYSFNKAHTMGYAHVTYQTAYLKAHYTAEYMAAVLCSAAGETEKVAAAVAECRRMGVAVLPPDVNRSAVNFTVENGAIRFGLAAVKNVGAGAVKGLAAERQARGDYASIEDFCGRIDLRALNKKTLESLIKAGALDSFGSRTHLLAELERIVGLAQQSQRAAAAGQVSLFGTAEAAAPPALFSVPPAQQDPATLKERLGWERELLGVYLGEHPLNALAPRLQARATATVDQLTEELVGQKVTMGGIVNSTRAILTRNGQNMLYAELEDQSGVIEVVVFPRTLEQTRALWQPDAAVFVSGKLDQRGDRYQLACDGVELIDAAGPPPRRYLLRLTIPQLDDADTGRSRLERVAAALRRQEGDDGVEVRVRTPFGMVRLATAGLRTAYGEALAERLVQLLGRDVLEVEELPPADMAAAS